VGVDDRGLLWVPGLTFPRWRWWAAGSGVRSTTACVPCGSRMPASAIRDKPTG